MQHLFEQFIKAPLINFCEKFQSPKPPLPKSEWGDFYMDEYGTLRLNLESENVKAKILEHFNQVEAYHKASLEARERKEHA